MKNTPNNNLRTFVALSAFCLVDHKKHMLLKTANKAMLMIRNKRYTLEAAP